MKPSNKRPFFVSITGDICSGKSVALSFYATTGHPVVSADDITAQIYESPKVTSEICRLLKIPEFSMPIVRDIVFNDPKKLQILENVIHPKVLQELQNQIDFYTPKGEQHLVVFFEIPLLFECNMQRCFDLNLLITADEETKITRLITRYGYNEQQARQRMNYQMPQEEKETKADVVIHNKEDFIVLYAQLSTIVKMLPFARQRRIRSITNV